MWGMTPFEMALSMIVYFTILLSSIIIALKSEQGKSLFSWLIVIFFIPFFGSVMYLIYFFNNKKRKLSKVDV
ncbi:MAG TPA: PLDc N-terminal domain-containing protein [Flavobacterium sp.]|nr:PLDc N-terminal domain-containing protein [Flavobacterium sp.]